MTRLLLGRLVQAALVALVVGGLCFALVRVLPGDVA
ncbi:ABC transporter permease, partial [Enterococcus sp. HPCN18]